MEASWLIGAAPRLSGRLAIGVGLDAGGKSKLPDCRLHQWWCSQRSMYDAVGVKERIELALSYHGR